jgi:hypothetical protein
MSQRRMLGPWIGKYKTDLKACAKFCFYFELEVEARNFEEERASLNQEERLRDAQEYCMGFCEILGCFQATETLPRCLIAFVNLG